MKGMKKGSMPKSASKGSKDPNMYQKPSCGGKAMQKGKPVKKGK